MASDRFEKAALGLAAQGYYVFPCRSRGKAPLTPNGFKDATRDEQQIVSWWTRWPDANVAIACGASEIVVIDIDPKHGADPREVIPELGLEHHPVVWTGEAPEPSAEYPNSLAGVRGAHLYFGGRLPTCKTEIPGVDIRGDGAYVLAPPSVHESGWPYEE
jgi:putative DNA primase/helicase